MRKKEPTLAEILYEAYVRSIPSARAWSELADFEKVRWQEVADAAQDWARENVAWEE